MMAKDERAADLSWFALHPTRREFLLYMGLALGAAACGTDYVPAESGQQPEPDLASDPFTLGVASGDPLPQSVILWTRLAMDPLHGGGMPEERISVAWEVALDENFATVVRSGRADAIPAFAHSVHVDADGLAPETRYWYRFRVGQWTSPSGRTRTLPAANSSPESFRIGLASCQNYRDGYYHAHRYLAQENVDLVAFVGDYIYESGIEGTVRNHDGPVPETLVQYRNRYALYKSDPNLQAAHRSAAWLVTWDDHEVRNNYANLHIGSLSEPEARALRAAAYQAYYEHQPLRLTPPSDFTDFQIYRSLLIGDLISLHILDGRQYRSDPPCGGMVGRCSAAHDPGLTMLGNTQLQWLEDGLRESTARWNLIAQQTVFAPVDFGGSFINPDQWDGYQAERQQLINVFADVRNVVVLTGDIHAAGFARLHLDPHDATSPLVGHELVGTSISSGGDNGELGPFADAIKAQHPYIEYLNAVNRGYIVVEVTRQQLHADYRIVTSVESMDASLLTDASFTVPAQDASVATSSATEDRLSA